MWCEKCNGRSTPSGYVVPTFGCQPKNPRAIPMSHGFNSRRTDPPRTINFINGHNGVPKANLLNMHNKKLIARRAVASS
jgi:hypothetical protein